ncbi:MAG: DUF2905 domain-containing protein [Rhodocyclaceae bacterium]|jgi:hypothetical protein|nr:DUF2905 domain-containing protein [Rhodocyclaceae bacterium]MCP5232209.1 DUF2905 domain-containing protein [Zoogloeaceae bacterium]MCB1911237.1 DUF2905 domain-containing protein [Rhodocyclaceae bacterium]MCP5240605.1 DUF2905 domain-containing protein [Zoogloeaceae bacterium]MCP5253282.1 DUF2905 domain-containing protein [Zoogloeaceae bacterium]
MLKWVVVIFLVVVLTGVMQTRGARALKLGELPGDLSFTILGKRFFFPFTTTILLSFLAWLLMRLL